MRNKIALLIPANNEEQVIEACLAALIKIVPKKDVYVVNDGSTDKTYLKAIKYTENILTLKRSGKANALNSAIQYFRLVAKYDYIMPIDADTEITADFLSEALKVFEKDKKKEISAVCGKVVGTSHNWLSTYRLWEYEVTQAIHKSAQSEIGAIMVCPGCTTVFRSRVFSEVMYPTSTLTEDMDLTFLIHRKDLGKIVYAPNSYAITQDPRSFREFIKQIERWYIGFWQCLIKHDIPWGGQKLDFEATLLATEGLFNGLLVLVFVLFAPVLLKQEPTLLGIPAIIDFSIFLLPTMILSYTKTKSAKIFYYIPHFYLLRLTSSIIFLMSFIKVTLGLDTRKSHTWQMTRYAVSEQKEEVWLNPSPQ